jgi:hypothetical protein
MKIMKWRPIKTAPDERILVWDGDMIHLAWLDNEIWQGAPYPGDEPLSGVTHWLPLPEPPQ